MDEKNCVCGVENCAAMTEHAIIAENACWGQVGFELPGEFSQVYLSEGPILKDKVVNICDDEECKAENNIHAEEDCPKNQPQQPEEEVGE